MRMKILVLLAICATLIPRASGALAEDWAGLIEGSVTDPQGAPIPGASVRLANTMTGAERGTVTDNRGAYSLPLVAAGTYELDISKQGFAGHDEPDVVVRVGATLRIDVTMRLARERTQVTVRAGGNLVNTVSPEESDEISPQRVQNLPLDGRQFAQLALLAGGAVPPYPNSATQQFNTAALGLGFSVDGQRSERNNFSLDGVTIMEPFAYSLTVDPSLDAIREFRVVENSYSAAQGIASGAQVEIVTRTGTNQFSGSAYEYFRNSALDARNFFDNPSLPIPPYRQNQFGASLGGPIRRDRTFFFGNYEGLRIGQSITNETLLPTAAERNGDLSGINPATGQPFPAIINPATGQPFPGNQIPVPAINPVSAALLARVPLPSPSNAASSALNSIDTGLRTVHADQFTVRVDHQINTKEQIFGRFLLFNSAQLFPFVPDVFANNPPAPPGFGTNHDDVGRNLALGLTSVLSPTLVNDFRFGYQYYHGTKEAQNISSGFLPSVGITRAPGATNNGIPAINIPGYGDLGDSDIFQPQIRKNQTFQFTDSLVWVKGRHTFRFGADVRRLRLFYLVEDFGQGVFDFSDGFSSVSGTAFSDFLLGRPFLSFAQAGNSGGNDRTDYFGAYFTDEFHATPRLSLTYGLREEFYSPAVNIDGRASILDPTNATRFIVLNNHGQAAPMIANPTVGRLTSLYGLSYITSEQAGLPDSLIRPDRNNWAPRFGFAYDLTGDRKTALRGGAGIFNSLMELDYISETRLSPPLTEFLFGLDLCRFYGPGACGQPFAPPVLTYPLAYTLGNQPPDAVSSPPGIRNGYVYEWNLSLERELGRNTQLEISYNGSDGHHLPRRSLQNQGVPNLPDKRQGYHPQPGSNQFTRATDVNSTYAALVVRLTHRTSHGLTFEAGYTYGKSIDDGSGLQGTSQPQNVYDIGAERGLSDFDVRHRFVLSNTWEIPLGPGRRWLTRGAAGRALGGWQASNILTFETGQPMTAVLSTALSGTGSNGTDRPDLVANPNLPGFERRPAHWFNTASLVPPPIYNDSQGAFSILGDEGRNVIIGPGYSDWDLSLARRFRLTERGGLVFRSDFFNLANHPNFDRPGLIVGTSDFGVVTSAENGREVQFALRLEW
ncbi:MAG TPA: carboxypeptidase regulatory-like domain-containing protein [Terriglobia bacterium]|nr:carboxypeptidase regulatory-like domain-containing protein [Terriglobia bacterium]